MVEEVACWLDPPPVARCSSRPSPSTSSSRLDRQGSGCGVVFFGFGGFVRRPSHDRSALRCLPPLASRRVLCAIRSSPAPREGLLWPGPHRQLRPRRVSTSPSCSRHGKPPEVGRLQGPAGLLRVVCHFPDSSGFGAFVSVRVQAVFCFLGSCSDLARIPSSSSCLHCVHWGLFGVEGLLAASGFIKKCGCTCFTAWKRHLCELRQRCYANLICTRVLPMLQNGVSVLGSRWGGQPACFALALTG